MTKPTTQPAMELPALPEPMTVLSDEDIMRSAQGWRQFDAPEGLGPVGHMIYGVCRAALNAYYERARASASSAAVGEDEWIPTNDFLGGHQCGLKWAAGLVEACSHVDGDWLYDDRSDLTNAILKGPPDMPTPPQAQPAPVAVDERALRDQCKQAWLNEPDDCTILEAYDRGWKDGYKHGAWAAAPAATVQAGQGVGVDIKRLVAFAKLFFSHGFHRPQTYNDTVLNSPEEAWAEDKFDDAYIKRRWGEAALAASKEGQSHE